MRKGKIINTSSIIAFFIPFIIFVGLMFCPFDSLIKENSPNKNDAKLKQILAISKEIPIYEDFIKTGETYGSKNINAGVYQYYRSSSEFVDIKAFYLQKLTHLGWVEEKENGKFVLSKGDIKLYIEHQKTNADWNYGISIVWRSY